MAIGAVIGIGRLLLDTAKMIFPDNDDIKNASNVADKVSHTYNLLTNNAITQSTNKTLISPYNLIDKTILHEPFLNPVMQVVLARDIQAILTHLAVRNAEKLGINIDEIVGSVQPARSGLVSLMGCEALNATGPVPGHKPEEEKKSDLVDTIIIGGKEFPKLEEYVPLAIGKVVQSTAVGPTGAKLDIPLIFREIPMPVSPAQLENIFSAASVEEGFFARLEMKNAEEITFPEWFTGKDIVKEKFRIRNDDLTGYYTEMNKRERVNKLQGLRTQVYSMNTMANTFIISSDTARQIELKIGRSFKRSSNLPAIFEAIRATRIIICDVRNGVFEFIDNGDYTTETYTLNELKQQAKKSGDSDTLEALTKVLMGR